MAQTDTGLKFSVVIPVYNGAATIGRAIESVLAQTYPAHELIVVDDASRDDTCWFIKEKYPSVTLVEMKVNGGSSVARNNGMEIATGDYIAFLDADDIWHTDKLRLMNAVLVKNTDITLLYNLYTQKDIARDILPADIKPIKLPFIKLLPGNIIATSCMVIQNIPEFRFEPTMRYTEDFDLCLRVCYRHNIFFVPLPLTQIFRGFTTQGGISGNKWLMRKGEMKAYARMAKLNVLFVLLVPVLWMYSLLKHSWKAIGSSK